jgi:PAS domain S-box-containing protein
MASRSMHMPPLRAGVLRRAWPLLRRLVEPLGTVEEKRRRRLRLLSAFLLLMAINSSISTVAIKNAGNSSWVIMLATAAILATGYGLSRYAYFGLATAIAVSTPAIPILAMILFSPNREEIPSQLPWLALPLLICSLLLSLRSTIIIAISYAILIIILTPFFYLPVARLSESLAFMFMIILFVVAVTAARRQDQLEMELQLAEQKRAEEALKESEKKFSIAFRSIPDAIAITTLKDGRFIEVNDSYTRITGYTREEVIGHSSAEFGVWAKAEERTKVLQMLKEQGRISNEEVHLYIKSGEIRTSLFSAEIINIAGEPCMISVATDITELKRAEEELKQALSNLEQSSARLTAANKELETFSYSVSHDLRSPLRSIDGFSQALLEDYTDKLDEQGQDYLKRLRGASQKMGELIDGLLKLSRLTRSEMHEEKVDMSALAGEIAQRLREEQPDRRADFVIDTGLITRGDPQLLRVLLENLIGNAWKFTSQTPQAKIEFSTTRNGDKKAYFIRDNGAGFDMAYAGKLFGAFQRLHDTAEFPGTGIGLATVQRIINRHGGTIWAKGEVGKGATFYFTLN